MPSFGTDSSFKVRNTLVVNTALAINSTGIYFSNTFALNATSYTGTSNNSTYLNGVPATAYVNASGTYTFSGVHTHNANLVLASGFMANNNLGFLGDVLCSNGTSAYWASSLPTSLLSGNLAANRITGLATSATTDTTNAANIITGQMNVARVAGLATSATTDTTNATNISAGTLSNVRLANVLFSNVASQTIYSGVIVSPYALNAGSFTVNCGLCPLQYITNSGAFTITAPTNDGSCVLLITNSSGASTVTFSGFSTGASTGDPLTTTNGHKFMVYIVRINGNSTYSIKSLQ